MVPLVVLMAPFANEARRKTGRQMGRNELIGASLEQTIVYSSRPPSRPASAYAIFPLTFVALQLPAYFSFATVL